jgi:hypothetical protein
MKKPIRIILFWLITCTAVAHANTPPSQAAMPLQNPTKPRTSLLPLGDALVFTSIGTVLVAWLRKRRAF